jgi:sugar lactone lactonase YvrE
MRNTVVVLAALLAGTSATAFVAGFVGGCSSSSNNNTATTDSGAGDVTTTDSGESVDSSSAQDSGTTTNDSGINPLDSSTDAGYVTLPFDPNGNGSPDAIYWDNTNQVLYIVDDLNNQVWSYTDKNGFQKYAQVPDNPELDEAGKTKLNGITELADGTLVVTRFGYGIGGAIYTVSPDGGTATVPNVPAARKRIEVTVDPSSGTIYSDSFTGGGGATPLGEIETVDLANGTTSYATGFGKTVGLLVQGSAVLVSDQTNNAIFSVPTDPTQIADGGAGLANGNPFALYAGLSGPDQLSAGPDGTIFTDQFLSNSDGGGPQIRQIWPDGGVTIPYPNVSFTSLSDVAYDATNHRLFVVDNNGTTVRTIKIFPVAQ